MSPGAPPGIPWKSYYRHLLRWSKRLSFLAVALYAAFQWYGVKVDGQIKQVLALYDKYNSDPIFTYRRNLDLMLSDPDLSNAIQKGDSPAYVKTLMQLMTPDKVSYLDILSDFFDGLSVCVSTHLCQEDVAIRLFQPIAKNLRHDFGPYILEVRKNNGVPNFADGIAEFARKTPKPKSVFSSLYDFVF